MSSRTWPPSPFQGAHEVLSSEAKWAKHFFKRLKAFRTSCETLSMVKSNSPRRVRIAVIDTGIDLGNPLIQAVRTYDPSPIRPEWCRSWVGGEQDFHDDVGHGTNCAYLAHKAAPDADIYVAKVFSDKKFKLYQAKHIADVRAPHSGIWASHRSEGHGRQGFVNAARLINLSHRQLLGL